MQNSIETDNENITITKQDYINLLNFKLMWLTMMGKNKKVVKDIEEEIIQLYKKILI